MCIRDSQSCVYDNHLICVDEISAKDVTSAIKGLKNKHSVGPDGIPSYVYKGLQGFIIKPLMYIYNLSLKHQIFPCEWKISKVSPLPKCQPAHDIKDYRPVALPPMPAKIYESILHGKLYEQLKHRIAPSQHGFMKGRSVQTNLINFTEYVSTNLDEKKQVDVVYTDFSKAFDTVDHVLLIKKIGHVGFFRKINLTV